MTTDPHHAYCCMVCRSAPMLCVHRQLMSSTALKHRVSATVWGHQGDRLQDSSVDPPCALASRHRQAVPPHSRHMSCTPSAIGAPLDPETACTVHNTAPCGACKGRNGAACSPGLRAGLQGARRSPGAGRLSMAPANQGQLHGPTQSAAQAPSRACSASLRSCFLRLRDPSQPHSTKMPGAGCACSAMHYHCSRQAGRILKGIPDDVQQAGPSESADAVSSARCAGFQPP